MANSNDSEVRADEQNTSEGAETNENDTVKNGEDDKGEAVVKKAPIVETAEAKRARLKRQLKKVEQELGVSEEEVDEVKPKASTFKLDLAAKGFLNSNSIKGKDEYDLVTDMIRNTGKDIEDVIESKYFQAELRDLRSTRESKMASDAASGARKGQPSARDTVDYWVSKNELPPAHMVQLRRDVVNARQKIDSNQGKFSSNPVVGIR